MIAENDIRIISHLRNNARKKITHISKETKIPATTIYDKIKLFEKKFIVKYVPLLDFKRLGYAITAFGVVKAGTDFNEKLTDFLRAKTNINSLYSTEDAFLFEGIFKNYSELNEFIEGLEMKFNISEIRILNVIEELKKESFLSTIKSQEAPGW